MSSISTLFFFSNFCLFGKAVIFKVIGKSLRLQKYFYEQLELIGTKETEDNFEDIQSVIRHYKDGTKIEIDCSRAK